MNDKETKTIIRPISKELDRIARLVVDAAFTVHSRLGPGLLESVYEACHACEIVKRGLSVRHQAPFSVLLRWKSTGLRISNRSACGRMSRCGNQGGRCYPSGTHRPNVDVLEAH